MQKYLKWIFEVIFKIHTFSLKNNIYRLLRIWRAEVEKKGVAKASFDRVWRKFIQTRVLVGLLMMTVMALASFMSSVRNNLQFRSMSINPLVTNGLSRPDHLDKSIFILGELGFIFHSFSIKIMSANRMAPDETPRFAALHLGLFC